MDQLLGMILAGLAMFGSPGPAIVSIAATGAAFGIRRGLGYVAGIVVGTAIVAVMVASGLTGLVFIIPGAKPVLIGAAALYLIWLAYRIATAPPLSQSSGEAQPPKFLAGVGLALVNPKAYAGVGAVMSSYTLVAGAPTLDAIAKVGVITFVICITDPAWLWIGGYVSRVLSNPRASRTFNIFMALLLVAAVGWALLGTLSPE